MFISFVSGGKILFIFLFKYTDDYKYMADRLKAARIEAGLGHSDVARFIYKSQSYIAKIEAGGVQLNELALSYMRKAWIIF